MVVDPQKMVRDFDRQYKEVIRRTRSLIDEAHVAACNRTAESVRAEAVRAVRERYPGFKAAAIRSTMVIRRATYSNPVAVVRVRGRRTPLISFNARQTKAGVTVLVRSRKTVKGAFIATMPSGHVGVFKRTGTFGRRGNPRLERIRQLTTLSVPQAIEQQQILRGLQEFARDRYHRSLEREIKFRTGRVPLPTAF